MNVYEFLEAQHVPFETLKHPTTYSAERMASALHVSGNNVAKTVVLKADGDDVLAVLQATHHVDMLIAQSALEADLVELAAEDEIGRLFPDCELGAIPPFGSRYGMKTIVDSSLAEDETIVFEGNTHDEAISMRYEDYKRLERPKVAPISRRP